MDRVPGWTFRKMAAVDNCSHTTLAEAAGVKKFPTWEATRAFAIGCGAADGEVQEWRRKWAETERVVIGVWRKVGGTRWWCRRTRTADSLPVPGDCARSSPISPSPVNGGRDRTRCRPLMICSMSSHV